MKEFIIHCAYTKPSMDIGVVTIRDWHMRRGWQDIGYNYVIRRDGTPEKGRSLDIPGAHTIGHNRDSIGVCLVGGMDENGKPDFNFTAEQMHTLEGLVERSRDEYPGITIHGHREFSDKECPCFDVGAYFS